MRRAALDLAPSPCGLPYAHVWREEGGSEGQRRLFLALCFFEAAGRVSPRRAKSFSCAAKKRTQKKAAPAACDPYAALRGNLRRDVCEVCRVTHYAPAALRSNRRGKSDHEAVALCGATATSQTPRRRRRQKGWEANSQTACMSCAYGGDLVIKNHSCQRAPSMR